MKGKEKMTPDNEYRELIENLPAMVRRWNKRLECEYCNGRWLDFRGRDAGKEKGYGWLDGVHPDDSAWCMKMLDASSPKPGGFEIEYRLQRADGAWRRVFEQWAPLEHAGNKPHGYVSVAIDITDKQFTQPPAPAAKTKVIEMCASCKKISEGNAWHTMELYFERNTPYRFSHSVCPECTKRLYKKP